MLCVWRLPTQSGIQWCSVLVEKIFWCVVCVANWVVFCCYLKLATWFVGSGSSWEGLQGSTKSVTSIPHPESHGRSYIKWSKLVVTCVGFSSARERPCCKPRLAGNSIGPGVAQKEHTKASHWEFWKSLQYKLRPSACAEQMLKEYQALHRLHEAASQVVTGWGQQYLPG